MKKPKAGTQTSKGTLSTPEKTDDAAEAKKCQHDAGAEIIADMAGLAESGLNEPAAGAGDVGGRKRDGFAEGIEGLLDALFHFDGWLFLGHGGMAAEGAEAGSQHGTGRDGGGAKGEDHQHDGDEHDDGEDQGHR